MSKTAKKVDPSLQNAIDTCKAIVSLLVNKPKGFRGLGQVAVGGKTEKRLVRIYDARFKTPEEAKSFIRKVKKLAVGNTKVTTGYISFTTSAMIEVYKAR